MGFWNGGRGGRGARVRRSGRAGARGLMDAFQSDRNPQAPPIRTRRIHPRPPARHPGGHLRATGRRLAAGRCVRAGPREADGCVLIAPGPAGTPDPNETYPSARPALPGRPLLAVPPAAGAPAQGHRAATSGRGGARGQVRNWRMDALRSHRDPRASPIRARRIRPRLPASTRARAPPRRPCGLGDARTRRGPSPARANPPACLSPQVDSRVATNVREPSGAARSSSGRRLSGRALTSG
jgi:hypothetical protein